MARLVALLRGINVGKHLVRMEDLRRHVSAIGYANVRTFIASGNVVFETRAKAGRATEAKIERALASALGYDVATFVRTLPELADVVARSPFDLTAEPNDAVVWATFVRDELAAETVAAIEALATTTDVARSGPRVVYWLRRERGKVADAFGNRLAKILGKDSTTRNMTTVRALVERFGT